MRDINLTITEVEVQKLKIGPENINLELIKQIDKVIVFIIKLLNKILDGQNIPDELKTCYLILIYKNGSKKKCENCKEINITNPF